MLESPRLTAQTRRGQWQRRVWWRLAAGVVCLGFLGACWAKIPRTYPLPESRRLEARLEKAWAAVVRVLAERGYDIRREDRADGAIETDWLAVNPDYTASLFVTRKEDRYSDCGKPGLGRTYRGKQARLTVRLSAAAGGQAEIRVRAGFRTEQQAWLFGAGALVECQSRGRLEDEVFVETQVRALADRLQRRRHGWE